jgi:hypothetical protein
MLPIKGLITPTPLLILTQRNETIARLPIAQSL